MSVVIVGSNRIHAGFYPFHLLRNKKLEGTDNTTDAYCSNHCHEHCHATIAAVFTVQQFCIAELELFSTR